jgi:hypothetical protein
VIVLDANLLLYAYDSTMPQHDAARLWLKNAFSADELIGLPWQTISAFLRIATDTRLPGKRFTMEEAVGIAQGWIEQPKVSLLVPGERHWSIFQWMLLEGQARGPMVTDAQLAAMTIEYGGVLHTTDRGFARFPGLRWVNPLLEY